MEVSTKVEQDAINALLSLHSLLAEIELFINHNIIAHRNT